MKAKAKVSLQCHVCGTEYLVQPYRVPRSKCCSRQCLQTYAAGFSAVIQKARRGTGTKHRYVKFNGRHEHRVMAEVKLGRPLMRGEIVHHKDDNGKNNHPDNLDIITQSKHIKLHLPMMMLARRRKAGY